MGLFNTGTWGNQCQSCRFVYAGNTPCPKCQCPFFESVRVEGAVLCRLYGHGKQGIAQHKKFFGGVKWVCTECQAEVDVTMLCKKAGHAWKAESRVQERMVGDKKQFVRFSSQTCTRCGLREEEKPDVR